MAAFFQQFNQHTRKERSNIFSSQSNETETQY